METLRRVTRLLSGLAAALLLALPAAAQPTAAPPAKSVKTEHVTSTLAPESSAAAPGGVFYVAVRQAMAPGWHTYWRNPGDSGEPTTVKWTLPSGWSAGDIVWPAPTHEATGPLMNYVYSGVVLLPVALQVPADAKAGAPVRIEAKVDYLVCKDVCVPETVNLLLETTVAAGSPAPDPAYGAPLAAALAAAPKAALVTATFGTEGSPPALRLSIAGDAAKGAQAAHAWFYPYDAGLIDHAAPERVSAGSDGLTFLLKPSATPGKPPQEVAGVVVLGPGRAFEVTAKPGAPPAGTMGGAPVASSGSPGAGATAGADAPSAPSPQGGFLGALAAAFLGGLILNLMPCVFPVLSIKAAQFARHLGDPRAARAEGLAFLAGVVVTFVTLAAALLAARAAGQAVGWGFQLQSPAVVATLALVMLAAALNLSGVFEVGTSVQGAGSGLAAKGGLAGAFFTGVLAVVVAAPCTAPFMAGAIGWAVTQPPLAALAVFAGLGLGLAAPLTALSFAPALFKRLPRPGAWMEGFKKALAFPMYGAAAWLVWVFALQAGVNALPFLFAAAVVLAFGAWLWGVAQRSERPWTPRAVAGVAGALAVAAVVFAVRAGPAPEAVAATSAGSGAGLPVEPWSPARVAELSAAGRPVFVDFTAAWCVTCQVNERTALAGKGVADAFTRTHAAYLKADWTRRDAGIARALSEQGRSGVPLYLVYAPGSAQPKVLPQLLSEGVVVGALEAAAKPAPQNLASTAPPSA